MSPTTQPSGAGAPGTVLTLATAVIRCSSFSRTERSAECRAVDMEHGAAGICAGLKEIEDEGRGQS